jgi:hypothetical protein
MRTFVAVIFLAAVSILPQWGCQERTEKVKVNAIPYRVVEEWNVGRTIVIDSSYVNEPDLRRLGEQLRREAAGNRFVLVYVFDDRAAAMSRRAAFAAIADEELRKLKGLPQHGSRTEENLVSNVQKHRVGEYWQNANTGNYTFYMFPEGYEGRMIEVKY